MTLSFAFEETSGRHGRHGIVHAVLDNREVGELEWGDSAAYPGQYKVVGVSVLPALRRRGIATAMYSAWMSRYGIRLSDMAPSHKSKAGAALRKHLEKVTPNASYLARLINHYGVTHTPALGGFILPDGSFLDFSEGSGSRSQDHRNITWVLPKGWEGPRNSRWDGMVRVAKKVGMYRWMPEHWSIDAWTPPTPQQAHTLTELARWAPLIVDAEVGRRRLHEKFARVQALYVAEVLQAFFDGNYRSATPNPRNDVELSEFPKRCNLCGTTYTKAQWGRLPLLGYDHCEWGDILEYRNCPCGTTLAIYTCRVPD